MSALRIDKSTIKVFKMSLPIFVELLLQLLVGNMDQIMISRVSQNSVAAIGNANQIINISIIVLSVISIATTVLIAQYLGAKHTESASEVSTVSTLVIVVTSIAITGLLFLLHNPIFTMLKVPEEIFKETSTYLCLVAAFLVVQGLYLNLTAIMRSFGLLTEVMVVSLIMNVLNVFGNAVLIYGFFGLPSLGIVGVAISTNVSKCIGLLIVLFLFRKKVNASISLQYLRPFPTATLKNLLGIGLPSGGEQLSYNVSQACILGIVNLFGTSVINTKLYSSMLANVSYVYSMAIGQATQILIGFLIGAGEISEIKKRIWSAIRISILVSLSITLIMYLNSDFVFGIFTDDPVVLELGKKILFIEFFLEFGRSVNITMTRALIAAGDVNFPVVLGIICMWLIAFGLSYVFGVVLHLGLIGVWLAMTLDECVRAGIFCLRLKSGAWLKHAKTVK